MEVLVVRLVLFLLYITVFVVAVTGNFLVVYVVMTNKKMQTVTNIFITNLAVSDIMVNFTSLWLTPMYTYIGHWIFGGGLCHGLPLFQGTSIFISTMTLTAIAIDRYIVIVHNSSNVNINDRMSMRTCIIIIVMIWSTSLCLVMPYAVNMKLNFIGEPCNFMICSEDWSSESFRTVFGVFVMSLQFIVPFILIGISYTCIWVFLSSRRFVRERKNETNRKKRLLRMLIIMVVIFAVCWFPFNLLNILRDIKWDAFLKPYFSFVFLLVHLISMTATCWNPILYAWMNESFREEFAKAVPFLFGRENKNNGRVLVLADKKTTTPRNESNCTSNQDQQSDVGESGFVSWIRRRILHRQPKATTPKVHKNSVIVLNSDENNDVDDTFLL
ncbi:unnamed protein product [Caenorhabditis bovis]|uniref:G-protein coupled receptors family 1 profile domain-containing protein n=1 Tax=Caenorhabditis bovis TaxID=2654633 RepID=A0A8S1ECY0_9PELO|nr:unnamed protein product [Caenorhabditis bovis]